MGDVLVDGVGFDFSFVAEVDGEGTEGEADVFGGYVCQCVRCDTSLSRKLN